MTGEVRSTGNPSLTDELWDLAVVGAGPAGATAALAALREQPALRVLLLDRSDFPRDKACGDGIAPHVLDVLAGLGLGHLLDDRVPVRRLRLEHGAAAVERTMARPAWVVPRAVFDVRLVEAAVEAGAVLRRHRVLSVTLDGDALLLDGRTRARVVVGADGAHSVVRAAAGAAPGRRRAMAIRGYAPVSPHRSGKQVIVFGRHHQPSYAWSFDRGDGWANVGYGEVLHRGRRTPTRADHLDRLDDLLPGAAAGAEQWRGHHLPLSSWRWSQPDGPLLLAGDAACLVNPMTGEGIYYAVATGRAAGRAAVEAIAAGSPASAGARHRGSVRALLGRHLKHTAAVGSLLAVPALVPAGLRAAAGDQQVFDDLVEVGLGRGRVTGGVVRGLLGAAAGPSRARTAERT